MRKSQNDDQNDDDDDSDSITRRSILTTAFATLMGAWATTACRTSTGTTSTTNKHDEGRLPMSSSTLMVTPAVPNTRMPVSFLPHGGGPWPFVEMGLDRDDVDELSAYLRSVNGLPKVAPKALLVISAHWEEAVPTVMTSERPPMFYDYYGFPQESYAIQWPAPGDPRVASRVRELLSASGIKSAEDSRRGFDHGTFVPLKLTYPKADVPTVQLSLQKGLDPTQHLAIGRALAPLRDEGVFIIGSGMSYHNMRGFRDPNSRPVSESFDAWLRETTKRDPRDRDARLVEWASAPSARGAHPREEHLLPLMVVAGAAGEDVGRTSFNGTMMGVRLSAHDFG